MASELDFEKERSLFQNGFENQTFVEVVAINKHPLIFVIKTILFGK